MNLPKPSLCKCTLTRRAFLYLGGFIFFYPLFRFVTHKIPRKPLILEIHEPLNSQGFLIKNDFIIFSNEETVWAVSRKCTHLGCKLNYKENENVLECPCHQSRFRIDGSVVKGPAKKTLAVYHAELKSDPAVIIITI